jgi:hypothetical protein
VIKNAPARTKNQRRFGDEQRFRAKEKVLRHGNYGDVSQPFYQRARQRWRHYEKYFQPYLEKLEPFVKAFGYE